MEKYILAHCKNVEYHPWDILAEKLNVMRWVKREQVSDVGVPYLRRDHKNGFYGILTSCRGGFYLL